MRKIAWIVLTATGIVMPIALLQTPAGAAALDTLTSPSATPSASATATPREPKAKATSSTPTAAPTTRKSATVKQEQAKSMSEAALLRVGSRGAKVADLQARLSRAGYFNHRVTGYYGTVTASAVRSFQVAKGLPASGEVDRATWRAVQALPLPKPKAAPKGSAGLDPRCTVGRVICVNKTTHRLSWVVDGKVIDSYSVRTGRPGYDTREGTFHVYLKSRNSWSKLYHVNMPYSMYFSGGQAVHYSTEFATRGYGVGSHGCVNMRDWNGIAWLYGQVRVGDTVVVYRS